MPMSKETCAGKQLWRYVDTSKVHYVWSSSLYHVFHGMPTWCTVQVSIVSQFVHATVMDPDRKRLDPK